MHLPKDITSRQKIEQNKFQEKIKDSKNRKYSTLSLNLHFQLLFSSCPCKVCQKVPPPPSSPPFSSRGGLVALAILEHHFPEATRCLQKTLKLAFRAPTLILESGATDENGPLRHRGGGGGSGGCGQMDIRKFVKLNEKSSCLIGCSGRFI